MMNASKAEDKREARHTDANTEALRDMALDTLKAKQMLAKIINEGLTALHCCHSYGRASAQPTFLPKRGGAWRVKGRH